MMAKVEKLHKKNEKLKVEVKEYKILDEYLKKENEQLEENSQRLQEEFDEASTKLKKVLRLIHYTRIIRKELKEETSGVNVLEPSS